MRTQDCDHNWVEDSQQTAYSNFYDPTPVTTYFCTECGMTKEIVGEINLLWYEHILAILFIPLLLIYLGTIMPIMFVIDLMWNVFDPEWKVKNI
jgi:hypothetical protein